jgi:hypothetical protein
MRVESIRYGILPFGPSTGQRSLLINIVDSEEEGELLEASFTNEISKRGLFDQFIEAINGTQSTHLVFMVGTIEKSPNAKEWNDFIAQVSRTSLELQRAPDITKTKLGDLRAPFLVFLGVPRVVSGPRDFYQHFNCVIALIDGDDFSQLALQEMMNHQFSTTVIRAAYTSDIVKLPSTITKISILDAGQSNELVSHCIEKNFRYYRDYRGDQVLDGIWPVPQSV